MTYGQVLLLITSNEGGNMGFISRQSSPAQEFRENLSRGVGHLRCAGGAAARQTADSVSRAREVARPKLDNALVVVGVKKKPRKKWPWAVGAIATGVVIGAAGGYLWYRSRNEQLCEQLLVEELLDNDDDLDFNPEQVEDKELTDDLVESVTR
ncbi:hypothetical protein [Natronoglycomyces albus]|uniref:Transmembrane protein n=1 Tax=Natronoglycomyces albus TaxID=2811108 RepID=A0A895XQH4_9ACTN|nr:hypothetical protein [Natronoglycomyces albus]QSB05395.1 hypothetical protein JQS30_00150 [Natronoglycomyces albus]